MSLLLDGAPRRVSVSGKDYAINTDFRVSILFEQLMQEPALSDTQKIERALELYYPEKPPDLGGAVEALAWFYRCGKEEARASSGGGAVAAYDLEQDGEYIYAAFLSDYGLDLEAAPLHWWKFQALLSSLRPENLFCKIVEYRTADTKKMKGEQRAFYLKMKRLYALKRPRIKSDADDALAKALQNGEDISMLLKT